MAWPQQLNFRSDDFPPGTDQGLQRPEAPWGRRSRFVPITPVSIIQWMPASRPKVQSLEGEAVVRARLMRKRSPRGCFHNKGDSGNNGPRNRLQCPRANRLAAQIATFHDNTPMLQPTRPSFPRVTHTKESLWFEVLPAHSWISPPTWVPPFQEEWSSLNYVMLPRPFARPCPWLPQLQWPLLWNSASPIDRGFSWTWPERRTPNPKGRASLERSSVCPLQC